MYLYMKQRRVRERLEKDIQEAGQLDAAQNVAVPTASVYNHICVAMLLVLLVLLLYNWEHVFNNWPR